jgi:hypothetical protein
VASGTTIDLPEAGLWSQWLADGRIVHAGWGCPSGPQTVPPAERDVTAVDPLIGETEILSDTPDAPEFEGLVSPAGDRLAYFTGDPVRSLYLFDSRTGLTETIATGSRSGEPFHVHRGQWSLDGRYLQFTLGFAHGICD